MDARGRTVYSASRDLAEPAAVGRRAAEGGRGESVRDCADVRAAGLLRVNAEFEAQQDREMEEYGRTYDLSEL